MSAFANGLSLGWGVDALITDRPDLMTPLVSAS